MADIVDLADSDEDDCVQIVNQLQAAVVPAQKSFSCPICRYKAQDQKDILQHILQQHNIRQKKQLNGSTPLVPQGADAIHNVDLPKHPLPLASRSDVANIMPEPISKRSPDLMTRN